MKVVILSGGQGIHFPNTGKTVQKGMVEVGGRPLLCHIMKRFSSFGYNEFLIAAGKQQYDIKRYFLDYYAHHNDIMLDLSTNETIVDEGEIVDWKIRICDTGVDTKTGGRIHRLAKYLSPNEPFFLVYSDTLADIDINALLEAHKASHKKATITVYNASNRFGVVELNPDSSVIGFRREANHPSLINIGFMVLEPSVLDLIPNEDIVLEKYPLEELARQKDLNAYVHNGYYLKMDRYADYEELKTLYESGSAPWEVL